MQELTENTRCSKPFDVFEQAKEEFKRWVQESPTGEFSLTVFVNQGGMRGKAKISKKEDL